MVLQYQRLPEIVLFIRLWSNVDGSPPELDVIMNEHAVMNDCHVPRRGHGPVLGKPWSAEEDVVALPLARLTARVHNGDMLLVNGRSLAVRVSAIVVRVQDLHLVPALKEHSAIAAILSLALDLRRSTPLDVKLDVAESALRPDVPCVFCDGKCTSRDSPLHCAPIIVLPLGGILSAKKHNRVRRRRGPHPRSDHSGNRLPNLRAFR